MKTVHICLGGLLKFDTCFIQNHSNACKKSFEIVTYTTSYESHTFFHEFAD
jgi:hypothetical protein